MYLKALNINIPLAMLMVLISITPTRIYAETNVSGIVQLNESSIQYDRRSGTSSLDVSVRNIGTEKLLYPVKVIIESISSSEVTLTNPDGQTLEGKPYFLYTSPLGSSNTFDISQLSSNKRWVFKNPNRVRFNYQTTVLASKYPETLILPSEISQTPHPIIEREVNTRDYVGQIALPPGFTTEPSSLFVKTYLAGKTAITHEGLFQLVMNSDATTLMTVAQLDGNEIMMKLYPKGEYLAEINPVIDAKSTAIALVALDPGFLTTVPQLDAMLLAALNTLQETEILADQISYEMAQGTFSVNGPYSESIQEKINAIHLKFKTLRAEDVLDLTVSAKIEKYLIKFLDSVISTAHADWFLDLYLEECSDGFSNSFQGNPGNHDEICISAEINSDKDSIFAIWNRKSRWAVFKDMEIAAPSAVFDFIPPRHISMPSAFEFFKSFSVIGTTAVADVLSSNYWKSIFNPSLRENKTAEVLNEYTTKYFGVRKSVARYKFPKQGENNLATISFSKNSAQLNNDYVDFWAAPTLVLTAVTEIAAPVVSIGMELNINELNDAMSRDTISGCVTKPEFGSWIAILALDMVQLFSEGDSEDRLVDFFIDELMFESKTYNFLYCIAGIDFKVLAETKLGETLKEVITDIGLKALDKATIKAKLAGSAANIYVAFRDAFNEDLAAIDHYKAIVGISNPPTPTGIITTDFGLNGNELGNSVTVQADGKILVAGYSYNGTDFDFALTRYNTDGSLDATFGGGDGIVTTDIGSSSRDLGYSVTVQTDGKILLAGDSSVYGTILTRYNSNGDLDSSFGGGDGISDAGVGRGHSATVQADGKILVAGTGYFNVNYQETSIGRYQDIVLTRYDSNGDLDSSFGGGDGWVSTDVSSLKNTDWARGVTVQADGKILVAGFTDTGNDSDFALIRYDRDGDLDATFGGGDGIVTTNISSSSDVSSSVTVQADGKILVAGSSVIRYGIYSNRDFTLIRYDSNGDLDATFGGGDGIVTTDISSDTRYGSWDNGTSVTVQADGKILVAGYTDTGNDSDFALIRYDRDGDLDTTFGDGDGIVTTNISPGDDRGNSATVQADGKILVAGFSYNGNNYDFALVRYNIDGSLDSTFNGGQSNFAPVATSTN